MSPSDLAFLSLKRRPVSTCFAILSLGLALGFAGWALNFQRSALEVLSVREPGVDYILGPKSNSLSILLDGIHFAGTNDDVFDYFLLETILDQFEPGFAVPLARYAGYRGLPVIGVEDSFFDRPEVPNAPVIEKGRWYDENTQDAVLGADAAKATGLSIGDEFVATSIYSATGGNPVWAKPLTVVGILKPSGLPRDRGIYTHMRMAWYTHKAAMAAGAVRRVSKGRGVTSIWIGLDPNKPSQGDRLREAIQTLSSAQIIHVEEEIESLRRLFGRGQRALQGVVVLLLFLAIAISALLFNERFEITLRDLGVMRALGYSRGQVARTILWEGFFISILSVCVGMVLERFGALLVPMIWNPPWLAQPPWPNVLLVLLWVAVLAASFLATLFPLTRLYRWNPHDALKGM